MRQCGTCLNEVEAPHRTCAECKEKAGRGVCRKCGEEIVRPPGKTGPLPKVCDGCKQKYSKWELMTPEQKKRHAKDVTERRTGVYVTKHREWTRRTYWHLKLRAIELLGGSCKGCGISNPLVLSVNHLNNGKGQGARADGGGHKLYRLVLSATEPHRHFDLRCLNCQHLWEYETGKRLLPDSPETSHLLDFLDAR